MKTCQREQICIFYCGGRITTSQPGIYLYTDEKEDTVSLRDLAPLPDEPEPIKGNLQGESITRGPHFDNGRNEEG